MWPPNFFAFLAQVTHYLSGVEILKKFYGLENFRANVLNMLVISVFQFLPSMETRSQESYLEKFQNLYRFYVVSSLSGNTCLHISTMIKEGMLRRESSNCCVKNQYSSFSVDFNQTINELTKRC